MKLSPLVEFIRDIPDGGAIIAVADRADRNALIEAVHTLCGGAAVDRLIVVVLPPSDLTKLAAEPLQVIPFRVMTLDAAGV